MELLSEKLYVYGAGQSVIKWVKSYMSGRRQFVEYEGKRSEILDITVGSPQGSVISPLLFLIMVSDLEEWVSEGSILSYADDTTCYAFAKDKSEVRRILEQSAVEILSFMSATLLSANPTKTKFIMFSRGNEEPIKVGSTMIQESREEVLLGMTFNKQLTWKSHLDGTESGLRQRIGILRLLSYKLPINLMLKLVQPIFTSKVQYGLQLLSNIGDAGSDISFKRLQNLHRLAMKAAFGLSPREKISYEDLLLKTGQKSLKEIAWKSIANMACDCLPDWSNHPLVANRIETHIGLQNTRQSTSKMFPPQPLKTSIVNKMIMVWDTLPDDIKQNENKSVIKLKLSSWAKKAKF